MKCFSLLSIIRLLFYYNYCFCASIKLEMATLDPKTLPVLKKTLLQPPLEEIATVLNNELPSNFQEVKAEVVECPDLTQQPFTLANKGLCGKTKLVEVGGPSFLLPLVDKKKIYDIQDIARITNSDPAFIIGASAGSHPYAGTNCEGINNVNIANGKVDQQSRISKVDKNDPQEAPIQEILPQNETRIALLANLFISEGKQGKVLKIHAKKRIGPDDFIASIRKALEKHYKNGLIGLGGTFLIKEGKAKQHVMRDFSKTPINTDEELNNWLKFYEMSAPLIAVGTLVNADIGGLKLRVQHFHSFSHHGQAGHYHNDVTPEIVEYLGYFNLGEEIYRIDAPAVSSGFGAD